MAASEVTLPAQVDKPARRHRQYQQRKILPQHTLFGTVLDNSCRNSLKDIEGGYISEGYMKPVPEKFSLSQHLKDRMPGRDKLQSARHRFLQQKSLFGEADKHLKMKQEQSLTFGDADHCFDNDNVLTNLKAARTVASTVNQRKNGVMCKPSAQQLRNNLLKDTIALNNVNTSMPVTGTTAAYIRNRNNGWRRYQPIAYDVRQQSHLSKDPPICLVELPANIRHKFGSRNCDALFCDKDLVTMSIDRQKPIITHQRSSRINTTTGLKLNFDDDYENLGQKLRYDIFPGATTDQIISQTHKDFNNQIHLRRVMNPDTFHHKRDELITWSEQNILRERMKKAWDEKYPPAGS